MNHTSLVSSYLQYVDRKIAAGLAAALLMGTAAGAQTALNPRSDILGIQLGDSIETVKKKIAGQFPGSPSFDVKTTLATPEYKDELNIGTLFDITTASDKSENANRTEQDKRELEARTKGGLATGTPLDQRVSSTGDHGRERITVAWYSGAHGGSNVFGIGRVKQFLAADRPLASATTAALVQKYGQPLQANNPDRSNANQFLFWNSLNNVDRRKCLKENRYPFLYEEAGFYTIEPFEQNAVKVQSRFVSQVNLIHKHNQFADLSRCGILLRAHLVLSDDLQYVQQLNVSLVDAAGGQSALGKLGDDFFARVDQVRAGKLQSAGQKTPKM